MLKQNRASNVVLPWCSVWQNGMPACPFSTVPIASLPPPPPAASFPEAMGQAPLPGARSATSEHTPTFQLVPDVEAASQASQSDGVMVVATPRQEQVSPPRTLNGKPNHEQVHFSHLFVVGCRAFCCCLVIQSCLTLRDPKDQSTPGPPVFHGLWSNSSWSLR